MKKDKIGHDPANLKYLLISLTKVDRECYFQNFSLVFVKLKFDVHMQLVERGPLHLVDDIVIKCLNCKFVN